MENNVEDKIFFNLVKRYKEDYEPSQYPHNCSMCQDETRLDTSATYKLKYNILSGVENPRSVPYIFICKDCYDDLPNREDK